ncbi:hypothetical protein MDOR_19830 [Mycolicibacterium doricum]|uniref:Lipoprotein antigen n=1 Tax=Mycolicibacterium doricum TaxID=126673 RepID=A0A1X1TLK4_9MYCO|nr:lipoprotein LpqH [Mycolicibacterium doricum]ORV45454.1 hypothetical protein AWC01_01490 [Mycolicibacterium doricum]BBZ07814.1 hypothetical protein MDOR_19830 [Mycolicibacterium doricum]
MGAYHRDLAKRCRASRFAAVVAAAALAVTGCSGGYRALATHTAQVFIDGVDVGEQLRVRCEQVQWVWHVRTLRDEPGFRAQVQTGETVEPRALQIANLGNFTGSYWAGTVGAAAASIVEGTLMLTGTAEGYFHDSPKEDTTARFAIRTDC